MSFISSLFSSKKNDVLRQPKHPNDLKIGDAFVFSDSFALPELLRGQNFSLAKINTYQYERSEQLEFVLQGQSQQQVYMSVEQDDEEYLNISIKLNREMVGTVFDLDQFADIFEQESSTQLNKQSEPSELSSWLADTYIQHTYAQRGFFYAKDFRPAKPPRHEDDSSQVFDAFALSSADEKFSIDIEVWEDGDTDVAVTIHRPLSDIVDYYPGSE